MTIIRYSADHKKVRPKMNLREAEVTSSKSHWKCFLSGGADIQRYVSKKDEGSQLHGAPLSNVRLHTR